MASKVKYDTTKLEKLQKLLKEENYSTVVGILGKKGGGNQHDSESGLTNASLGAIHEVGKDKIPARSFLFLPLSLKFNLNSQKFKELKKTLWKSIFVKQNLKRFHEDLGANALHIILDFFNAQGEGHWTQLTTRTKNYKAANKLSPNILTATGQMRNTIDFEIRKK